MGNLKIRKLGRKQRLSSGKSNHKHDYSSQVCVEVQRVDESGAYIRSDYYCAHQCRYCSSLELDHFLKEIDRTSPLIIFKSTHKWRLDKFDFVRI